MSDRRIEDFGRIVLEVLENEPDWNGDLCDRISREAIQLGIGAVEHDGSFKACAPERIHESDLRDLIYLLKKAEAQFAGFAMSVACSDQRCDIILETMERAERLSQRMYAAANANTKPSCWNRIKAWFHRRR